MALFYLIGFAAATVFLGVWFYAQEKRAPVKQLRRGFWTALALYTLGLLFTIAPAEYKVQIAFRDLMILGGFGLFLMLAFRLKRYAAILLVLGVAGLAYFLKEEVANTFPYQKVSAIPLSEESELLIELQEEVEITAINTVLERYDLSATLAFRPENKDLTTLDNYYMLDIPKHQLKNISKIKRALNDKDQIVWLEDNEVIQVAPLESANKSKALKKKYQVNDPGLVYLWSFEAMEMDKLYEYMRSNNIKPRKEVKIAILDTGVDANHEDISQNFTSIRSKYDNDPRGHGTHCAGIAGAVSNNAVGIASYAPNNDFVELTSVKVLNAYGAGTQSSIINGIIEAADNKVGVISMSLGGRSNQSKQRAYEKAINYARKAGAIVLASAGNSNDNGRFYAPANSRGLISVSAIDENLNRATFSNHVSELPMGIAAPGVNIYSTIPNNKYNSYSGTSMSCPYTAGLVGIMKAIRPDLTTEQVYQILVRTGKETTDTKATGKLIFPYQAVKAVVEMN